MDFNGLVRHYYLRQGDDVAEVQINLAGKKNRPLQSHAIGLRMRNELPAIADRKHARMKLVETPPGPPVIASVVAEVYGQPDNRYEDLLLAADTVRARLARRAGRGRRRRRPPGRPAEDGVRHRQGEGRLERHHRRADCRHVAGGPGRRHRGPGTQRNRAQSAAHRIARCPSSIAPAPTIWPGLGVKGSSGQLVPLAELGRWDTARVDQMIYHKNLQRVAYVFAETAGRPPADVVVDVLADRTNVAPAADGVERVGNGWMAETAPRPVADRTFFSNGSGIAWGVPAGFHGGLCRRGRVEDHARRVPRPGSGLRRGDDRHLRAVGGPNRLVRDPASRHAGDSLDDPRRDAGLLAAECRQRPASGRFPRIRSTSPPPA